jgi:signal transduction histidine kinase
MESRPFLQRWWLVPLMAVVVAGSIGVNLHHPAPIVLGALAALVLLAIDRVPELVLLNGLLVAGYFVAGGDNGPVFLTIPAATLLAALAAEVRRWLPFVIGSGVVIWAGLLVRGVRDDVLDVSVWQSFGIGAFVAAAAAIGTVVRTRRAALRDRQDRAASDEKLRMAQDLHDGVGHGLAVIAMQAGVALHVLDQDPAKARSSLEAIRETSREALDTLRSELAVISGTAPRRPAPGLADLPALLDRVRAAGLRVEVSAAPGEVPEAAGEVAYVVVQEALTNVLRHSGATTARIEWARAADGGLVLAVRDDGRGGALQDEGMGIGGMRTRVTRIGGTLSAGPRPGGGFEVVAELPA